MNQLTDQQLLREYTERRSEAALRVVGEQRGESMGSLQSRSLRMPCGLLRLRPVSMFENESRPNPEPDRRPASEASKAAACPVVSAAPPDQLTPEEQMAAFEKDLKENDWGHQPC